MSKVLNGRRVIKSSATEVNIDNILEILDDALPIHKQNQADIEYLYNYYKGKQPILDRIKDVRPEINNKIVENRANEIVSFKTGYLMGEPVQYVSRGDGNSFTESINKLNDFVFAEEKECKDKEIADWFHICGTAYRMALPTENTVDAASPFEIFTLDPRNAFVVYGSMIGDKPILGVKFVTDDDDNVHYYCYTETEYFEIIDESEIVDRQSHILGRIPIIEYPLNSARIGAFEIVLPLLDAINTTDSNRVDGLEQFVQSLMLFHNVDISGKDFDELRAKGAIKFSDIDPQMKASVDYLTNSLNQSETQTLIDHMYQTILTICGMPNRNGGSSTSDTGSAVIMRDGWSAAEARAKDSELMFKRSEREFLKLILSICEKTKGASIGLTAGDIAIRFTRRNYENIMQKAQVLDLLLKNAMVEPKLAFQSCGLFVDSELAYSQSMDYFNSNKTATE